MKKSDLNSMDFAVNRFFIKLFRTGDINIVKFCQSCFYFTCPVYFLRTVLKNSSLNTKIMQTCYAKWLNICSRYCEFNVT